MAWIPTGSSLEPALAALDDEFARIADEAVRLAGSLSDQQVNWRRAPGLWSIAECLDHLNATARGYMPRLDDGIRVAHDRGLRRPGPYRYGWLSRYLLRTFEPPATVRVKAPKMFQPQPDQSRDAVLAAFRSWQDEYRQRLAQANGLDLSRARVMSPVSSLLRLPLGVGFELMAAHSRRHLWQARNVLADPVFPRG